MSLGLIELESRPDNPQVASEVMREIHTLKGEAKMVGFSDVNLIAHSTEDLLCMARDRGFDLSAGLGDMILKGIDLMGALVQKKAGGSEEGCDLGGFISAVEKTKTAGASLEAPELMEEILPAATPEPVADQLRSRLADDKYIRIHMEKMDRLSDLIGDMLLTRSRLNQAFDELSSMLNVSGIGWMLVDRKKISAMSRSVAALRREIISNNRQQEELEYLVRDIRLVPISRLFANVPRVVRDLAGEQKKQIRVETYGLDTELDKQVLDQLADPLLHVVRNAVDHGIELPQERLQRGKKPIGVITLKGLQVGGKVEVRIEDDGAGIDVEAVKEIARKRGLEEHLDLDKLDWFRFLFEQGFSTAKQTTDVSGRGVGLDIVKQRIESLGGSVGLISRPGAGSCFVFSVPISISISQALLVKSGSSICAMPSYFIERLVDMNANPTVTAGTGLGLRMYDQVVPFMQLSELLGVSAPNTGENVPAVVIRQDGRMLALQVDKILGEREIMLKPLDPFLAGLKVYSGTATLPGGELAFVLNPGEIFRMAASHGRAQDLIEGQALPADNRPPTILVVDDSEITRDLVVEIIRAMGYRVIEAGNGQEALNRLREVQTDLILADIEMPIMDGLQLLSSVKAEESTHDIPVVVLSTLGSEEDKRKALRLGADSYIVKSQFHEKLLFDTVKRFLGR